MALEDAQVSNVTAEQLPCVVEGLVRFLQGFKPIDICLRQSDCLRVVHASKAEKDQTLPPWGTCAFHELESLFVAHFRTFRSFQERRESIQVPLLLMPSRAAGLGNQVKRYWAGERL